MRVSSYAVARPSYYDRNAASSVQVYLDQATPHGSTTRWTTTVAAGKKLACEVATFRNLRTGAATVAATVSSELQITSGGSTIMLISNRQTDNSLTTQFVVSLQSPFTLYAGETAAAVTVDTSTLGTIQYYLNLKGTLFDA